MTSTSASSLDLHNEAGFCSGSYRCENAPHFNQLTVCVWLIYTSWSVHMSLSDFLIKFYSYECVFAVMVHFRMCVCRFVKSCTLSIEIDTVNWRLREGEAVALANLQTKSIFYCLWIILMRIFKLSFFFSIFKNLKISSRRGSNNFLNFHLQKKKK